MKATYTIVLEINNRLNYTGIFLEILEIASLFSLLFLAAALSFAMSFVSFRNT